MASIVASGLQPALALVGGGFLGLAGIRHVAKRGMDRKELVATWTDLLVAGVMVVFLVRATLAA